MYRGACDRGLLAAQFVRLLRLERKLRGGEWHASTDLRGALDVSASTLKRDIRFLRDECGAHIEFGDLGYRLIGEWRGVKAQLLEQVEAIV